MSKNTNCLQGVRCPNCQQEDVFHIEAVALVEVRDNGTEDLQTNYEWEDDAFCKCPICEFEATLLDFTIGHQEKLLLSINKNICSDCGRDYTDEPLEEDELCVCRTEGEGI